MSARFAALAITATLLLLHLGTSHLSAAEEDLSYIGNWSNGRGETLVITEKTLKFGDDRAVSYRDITRATDGSTYELQITTKGEINAFPGKIVGLSLENDSMQMKVFASHGDYMQDTKPLSVVTWYKDDDDADE
jgi:hypothetical protein